MTLATLSIAGAPPGHQLVPGTFGLVYDHKPTIVHELIQARERVTVGKTAWADLTHSFCVTGEDGSIIEAIAEGVVESNIEKYKDEDYWLVTPTATPEQRALCVERWRAQVGDKYDVRAYFGEAMLAWGWPFTIHSTKQYICSGLVSFGALAWEVDFPQPFELMTPADLALFYDVPIDAPIRPLSFVGRLLDRVALVGRIFGHLVP